MIKLFRYALIAAITLAAPFAVALETNPKREHRSAWVTPISGDWPAEGNAKGTTVTAANYSKAEIDKIINNAKAYGLNALYVHMRPYADRIYNKNSWTSPAGTTYTVYEPFGHWTSGTRGTQNDNYDPLEYWVQQAHAAGIEIYAWINPYRISIRSGNYASSSTIGKIYGSISSTTQDESLLTNGWCIRYYNSGENNTYTVFNPCLEQSKSRITTVCRVLTGNYDIDGIIMDDYFYVPGGYPEDATAVDYKTWQNSGSKLSLADWRRAHVNDMVARCYEAVHEVKPWVRFSIGPAGVATKGLKAEDGIPPLSNYCSAGDWQYDQIYADPLDWLREHTIDFLSPQLYWRTTHSTNPFGPLTEWWSIAAQKFERPVWPSGYASSYLGASNTQANWQELDTEIQLTREKSLDNSPGYVHYSSKWVLGPNSTSAGAYIAANSCQYPAVTPAMTWFDAPNPGAITNLTKGDAKLSFDAKSNMRYIGYAVPQSVSPQDAMSEQGGFKAEYIIGVTYTNSIDIPAGKRAKADYWHAVAPLDRYGNEWPATTINAPIIGDCEVSLVTPRDGVVAEQKQAFTWTGTQDATYTFELSAYPDFKTINLTQTGTETTRTINFTNWAPGLKMYWRVKAAKSLMRDAVSDVRSIIIPGETNLPLYAPISGTVATTDISFVCKDVRADTYVLQVSKQSGFGTMVFEGSSNWTAAQADDSSNWLQYTVPISVFTDGAYFWRVIGKNIDGTIVATSEVRSLAVSHGSAAVAGYEPWHEDYELYGSSTINSHKTLLTNLWVRNADHNPTGINGVFSRGMVARPADIDQETDIVYVSARAANDQTSATWLYRFDANTGARLSDLQLTYDTSSYAPTFPNNGVILDDANHLIVHNLTTGAAPVYVGMVNPTSGMVTQKITLPVSTRVDHIDVWGDITTGDYYVFAASSGNKMYRWHIVNNAVSETKTYNLSLSTAPRVHAVSANRVWVDGSGTKPMLYDFSTGAVVSNGTLDQSTINESSNGVCTFKHDNKSFILYTHQHATTSSSHQWTLATLNDHTASMAGHSVQWTMPSSFSMGTLTDNGGDHGGPVSVLQHSSPSVKAASADNTSHIYMMSPANGIAAYALTTHVVTGVDNITVDSIEDNTDTTPVYYNMQGIPVQNPGHGIYIERRGNTTRKVLR